MPCISILCVGRVQHNVKVISFHIITAISLPINECVGKGWHALYCCVGFLLSNFMVEVVLSLLNYWPFIIYTPFIDKNKCHLLQPPKVLQQQQQLHKSITKQYNLVVFVITLTFLIVIKQTMGDCVLIGQLLLLQYVLLLCLKRMLLLWPTFFLSLSMLLLLKSCCHSHSIAISVLSDRLSLLLLLAAALP